MEKIGWLFMEIFLARQPIFSTEREVYGYEILYRDGNKNYFPDTDGEYASISALTRCFIDFGIKEITNGKKAFINFTEELFHNDIASIFPKEYLIIEILENIVAGSELINYCKKLKKMGYMLAIDDFTFQSGYEELIKIVDIIKVDFMISSISERESIVKKYKRDGLKFLAEKVETQEEYLSAIKMGYSYFQGFFFSKPEITKKKKILPYLANYIRLINMINSDDYNFSVVSKIIENDFAFSYEILRLVNSAYYSRKHKISSIRQALTILGMNELRKWIYLVFIRDLKQEKPQEIVNTCMMRGVFLENLAVKANKEKLRYEMMTLGMFSMIDILMNKSFDEVFLEIEFCEDFKIILKREENQGFIAECYNIVLCYEKGQWDEIEVILKKLPFSVSNLNEAYLDSIKWLQMVKR